MRFSVIALLLFTLSGCNALLGLEQTKTCQGTACAASDGGPSPACMSSQECAPGMPICDESEQTCRPCAADPECAARSGEAPVCDSESGACVACAANSDCDSEVCDTSIKVCVDQATLIYADIAAGSTSATCGTREDPCRKIQDALARVTETRDTIVVRPGNYNADTTTIAVGADVSATLLMTGATIDLAASAPVLSVGAGSDITLVDGTITAATASDGIICDAPTAALRVSGTTVSDHGGDGIRCDGTLVVEGATISGNTGDGIDASGGANLSVTGGLITLNEGYGIRSASVSSVRQVELIGNDGGGFYCGGECTLSRNMIKSNAYVGLEIAGEGTFSNNVIRNNGGAVGGALGGVSVFEPKGDVLFEFNTVIHNSSASAFSGGMHCLPGSFTISSPNNILWFNTDSGDKDDNFKGECGFTYSNVGGEGGTNTNIDIDPGFSPITSHSLTGTSACVDVARFGSSTVTVDYEGDDRPFGDFPDCGADEWVP